MAISAATKLSDFEGFIYPEEAAPIFDDAQRQSVVQQLVRRVPLPISGAAIPVVTTKPTANWVAEGGTKPATGAGLGLVTLEPKKLAAIAVISAEVVRANPGGYSQTLRRELAGAFATAFDYAALHNLGGDGTGTGPFEHYIGETSKSVSLGSSSASEGGVYKDIVNGLSELVESGKKLNGFAFDSVAEPLFLGNVDTSGHPLFTDTPLDETTSVVTPGRLIGRRAFIGDGVAADDVIGFGGDWSKAAWGVVGGISFRVSTEATVTINGQLTSLFEKNLVAVLAEAEYGFNVADVDAFVAYTQGS